ncbi:helix-turn-helix domain-containing protein [Bacillus sp. FJAT-29814]|uniref:helix-turn-helix domain-containing protein n=1 Tax=Bacillus sp. FJAT-29814 TaxID=1729688 RepID=UPI00082B9E30|nr:helix-turn-helix domain-containing protein [Bacillus sp. FJAT-29814]
MSITKRRREFLDHIYRQYNKTSLPVHYSEVAEAIGVSKWTAYDVLKELENQGLVKRTYAMNENEAGRSMVVFSPTELAETFFQKERREISNLEEWNNIHNQVIKAVKNPQNLPLREAINQTIHLMKDVEVKLEFCAYFLSILLLYLNSLGKQVKSLTVNVINASKEPKIQLTVFVGAVVGMIIQSVSDDLSPEMIQLVQQFFNNVNQLNSDEMQLLIELIEYC